RAGCARACPRAGTAAGSPAPGSSRSGDETPAPVGDRCTEADDRRNQVQAPEIQRFLPCLVIQTWSSALDLAADQNQTRSAATINGEGRGWPARPFTRQPRVLVKPVSYRLIFQMSHISFLTESAG